VDPTLWDHEDNRPQNYAENLLQEAQLREIEAHKLVTSIFADTAVEAVERATLVKLAAMADRTLDEWDEVGNEFERRVQECYEVVYGPISPAERARRRVRRIDDSSYGPSRPGAGPNELLS